MISLKYLNPGPRSQDPPRQGHCCLVWFWAASRWAAAAWSQVVWAGQGGGPASCDPCTWHHVADARALEGCGWLGHRGPCCAVSCAASRFRPLLCRGCPLAAVPPPLHAGAWRCGGEQLLAGDPSRTARAVSLVALPPTGVSQDVTSACAGRSELAWGRSSVRCVAALLCCRCCGCTPAPAAELPPPRDDAVAPVSPTPRGRAGTQRRSCGLWICPRACARPPAVVGCAPGPVLGVPLGVGRAPLVGAWRRLPHGDSGICFSLYTSASEGCAPGRRA